MTHRFRTFVAQPRLIAAVRRRVPLAEIGANARPALDLVWPWLGGHPGLRTDGGNLFLYHHGTFDPVSGVMDIDFGVEVSGRFEDDGEIRCVEVPGGKVVETVHRGPYDGLAAVPEAVRSWCAANGLTIGPASWEIYGDWTDDPGKLETTIVYLVE